MPKESKQFYFFYGLIVLIYSFNIGGNAIWTTHEAYYAEAVREMLESKVWSEFFFNYESRFQKPPMTYWLMASSSSVFGLSEFSLRLPMVLCSLLTVLLVYKTGQLFFDKRVALLSMLIFSMSLQFVWFRSYASPEIPLTLFFTLSLFSYFKGLLTTNRSWSFFSWVALGFTVLTKGFPYILLFFSIILIHGWVVTKREVGYSIKSKELFIGFLIASATGLSWSVFILIQYGDQYTGAFIAETYGRVTNHPSSLGILDSFLFYPQTILWSFFPFSLLFLYGLVKIVSGKEEVLTLPLIWLSVFLVVFTISSGKLPVYILQAHPAMALIAGFVVVRYHPEQKLEKLVWKLCLWFPGILIVIAAYLLFSEINLPILSAVPLVVGSGLIFYWSRHLRKLQQQAVVLWTMFSAFMLIIFLGLMPWVEQFRPYSKIQASINSEIPNSDIPFFIEGRFLDNVPFYAGRKVYGGSAWTIEKIEEQMGEKLVLRKQNADSFTTLGMTQKIEILWEGSIHAKGPEDHFFKFIRDCYLYSKGDSSKFTNYELVLIQ